MTENAKNAPQEGLAEELDSIERGICNGNLNAMQVFTMMRRKLPTAAGLRSPQPAEQQEAMAWKLVRGDEVLDQCNRVMVEQAYRLLPAGFAIAQIVIPDARRSVAGDSVRVPKDE